MQTIGLTYDPKSHLLKADSEGAGTTIDDCSVTFSLELTEPIPDATFYLVCDVVVCDGARRYHPPLKFSDEGTVRLPYQVLSACRGGTLPVHLLVQHVTGEREGSRRPNPILSVDVLPDAFEELGAAYGSDLMLRSDSWDWLEDMRYREDSFAVYEGTLYQSLQDDNVGHIPSEEDSAWWIPVGVDGFSPTVEWEGDVLIVTDADGPHESPPLTGPQGEKGDKGDKGDTGDQGYSITAQWSGDKLIITDKGGPKTSPSLTGPQGEKGDRGEPFGVDKVYESVDAMNAGYATDGVPVGGFVVITTGDVEDEDNAKLYVKGETQYEFITDMSGVQGIQGPQGEQGPQGLVGPQGPKGDTGDAGHMDAALDAESTNGVQNRVITENINRIDDELADKAEASALSSHVGNTSNPHAVTKAQVGLDKVDNTADMEKPVSTAMQAALNLKADESDLAGYVPTTRKVNGKALDTDITLSAADVGALPSSTHIPDDVTVDDALSDTSENPVQNKIIKAALDGKQDDFTVVSVNLPASGWSSNQQTVAVSGVTASTEIVVVSYSPGSYQAYTEAGVRATAQGAGSLTFACDEAPSADLVAEVMYA